MVKKQYIVQIFFCLLAIVGSLPLLKGRRIQYVGNIYADLTPADVSPDHVHPLTKWLFKNGQQVVQSTHACV